MVTQPANKRGGTPKNLPENKQKKPGTVGAKRLQKKGKKGNINKGKNAI